MQQSEMAVVMPDLVLAYEISFFDLQVWWMGLVGLAMFALFTEQALGNPLTGRLFRVKIKEKRGTLDKIIGFFGATVAFIFFIAAVAGVYYLYKEYVVSYESGDYMVAQGQITDFVAGSDGLGGEDTFSLQGIDLSYTSNSWGYRQPHVTGGAIDEGFFARIAYHPKGRQILRLEIEAAAIEASDKRRIRWEHELQRRKDERAVKRKEQDPEGFKMAGFLLLSPFFIAGVWYVRGRHARKEDPNLKDGYYRLCTGLLQHIFLPALLYLVLVKLGLAASSYEAMDSGPLALSAVPFFLFLAYVDIQLFRFIYWRDGVAKLMRHPGLIDSELAAKALPFLAVGAHLGGFLVAQFIGP